MENIKYNKNAMPYRDINDVLGFLVRGAERIFGDALVGFYLTGSLTYNDFVEERSDIDLAAVIKKPASQKEIGQLKKLHAGAGRKYKKWAKRIECSYIPLKMLDNTLPPKKPRPYVDAGKFFRAARYGNWCHTDLVLSF